MEVGATKLSFWNLSYLTFQGVLQVVLVAFSGFWCAYSGLLPKQGQKVISSINVDVFTPCLIFGKLAKSLSIAKILEIAVLPVFYALSTGIAFISGKLVARLLNLDVDETNFVVANAVFGNSNSLPVSLTLALAYTLPGLEWDQIPNDNKDNIASRGILYLLIWQQFGQVLRWTWGFNKLMKWSGERDSDSHSSILESQSTAVGLVSNDGTVILGDSNNPALLDNGSETSSETVTSFHKIKNRIFRFLGKINDFMNPPLYSMLLAVIVASIHPIQHELFDNNGFINNTFTSAIIQLGDISIPLILVILGANLYPSYETPQKSHNYKKLVIASIVARMILPSLLLLPIITLCFKYVKVSILDDPIFVVVGFLLTAAPPAIQLTQITQINEFFEAEMAGVLFWSYVILCLPASIFVVSGAISVLKWVES